MVEIGNFPPTVTLQEPIALMENPSDQFALVVPPRIPDHAIGSWEVEWKSPINAKGLTLKIRQPSGRTCLTPLFRQSFFLHTFATLPYKRNEKPPVVSCCRLYQSEP
jgi:hypothetical protein